MLVGQILFGVWCRSFERTLTPAVSPELQLRNSQSPYGFSDVECERYSAHPLYAELPHLAEGQVRYSQKLIISLT